MYFDPYKQLKSDYLHDWLLGIIRYLVQCFTEAFSYLKESNVTWWQMFTDKMNLLHLALGSHPYQKLYKGMTDFTQMDGDAFLSLAHFFPFALLAMNHNKVIPEKDPSLAVAVLARVCLDRLHQKQYTEQYAHVTHEYQKRYQQLYLITHL